MWMILAAAQTPCSLDTVKILITALVGFVFGVSLEFVKRRLQKDNWTATYLLTMAGALSGMADAIDANKVPFTFGHTLNGTIRKLNSATIEILGERTKKLKELAAEAKDNWCADARRLAGDLQAEAAVINLE